MIRLKFPKVPQSSPNVPSPLDQFLKILRSIPGATITMLAKEADVSERMVKKYIKELRVSNRIRRVGSNRKGYWEIAREVDESETPPRSL